MSRMIDDEETLKDYGLIENCSNLITEEKRCLDTWDNENSDYARCKKINCDKKQLKRLEAENECLKRSNQAWGLTVVNLREENEKLKKEIEKMRIECAECDLKNLGCVE